MIEHSLLEKTERIAQIGSWEWDISNDQWTFSEGFRIIHGIEDHAPMCMDDLWTLAHPEDRPAIEQAFSDALNGLRPYDIEHRIVRQHDASIRYVHAWGEVECNESGMPVTLYGTTQDITDRRQVELRNALLAAVVASSDDAIISVDLAGSILSWNKGAEQFYGYGAVEAIGQSLPTLIAPDETHDALQAIAAVAHGETIRREAKQITKAGHTVHVAITFSPVKDSMGRVVAVSALVRDITERKRLEAELRQSEARYRLLADGSPLPIAVIDAETGKVAYANPRAAEFFGVNRSDVIGRAAAEFYSDPKEREPFVALVREQGYVADFEVRMHTRGGQESWVSVSTTKSTYQGRPAFQSVYLDMTKRKQAEAALLQSEQRYRLLAENMTDVVWVMDVETGYFTYVSPSVERLRGYTAEEVIAQPASEALTPESQALVATILTKSVPEFMAGNVLQNPGFDVEQPRRDGTTVWTEAVGRFYRNEENGHLEIYGVSRNLTERRAKEAEIRRLNQELEQRVVERTAELSQALDELRNAEQLKDSFLASVSHELRTPLTGVLGMADALEMQVVGPLNEHQRRYVQQIQNSGERLLKMVNSILHYTALLAGKVKSQPEPCRLLELCAISMRTIRPAAELKKQTIKLNIDPHDLEITSDPDGLIQILNNLLDNAVKFTPEGGAIGLEVVDDPAQKVVHFTVWDTGIGIVPADQAAIFRPFEQVDHRLSRQYEGVGLGLAYVQQMVKLLGGAIAVESEPDKGSRFTVTLPLQPQAHQSKK